MGTLWVDTGYGENFGIILVYHLFQASSQVLLHDGAFAVSPGQPNMRDAGRLM